MRRTSCAGTDRRRGGKRLGGAFILAAAIVALGPAGAAMADTMDDQDASRGIGVEYPEHSEHWGLWVHGHVPWTPPSWHKDDCPPPPCPPEHKPPEHKPPHVPPPHEPPCPPEHKPPEHKPPQHEPPCPPEHKPPEHKPPHNPCP
ncbi:hypothetical protein [Yinghuangia seranimata]|uniref:hypothetical protein n=1 Tax=Yinghuangia seranimata TaxID=408067 RepID=UPI00248AB701|nr:hypothetical protein [Yinghuangia seranimata]MDI2132306.1 hypothetical protein [Yinghuangia seranimata]